MERLPRLIVGVGAGVVIGVKAWRAWKAWRGRLTAEEHRAERLHSSKAEVTIACPGDLCEVKEEEGTSSEVVPCEETPIPSGFEAPESSNGVVSASSPNDSLESLHADGGAPPRGGQRKKKVRVAQGRTKEEEV
ncbi:hypothetical protein BSKO_12493 [Bryopsis sp. KO-2023]|nr:hypothetical protein BSKO_12493 [Bryopsis sp. KO-2023]